MSEKRSNNSVIALALAGLTAIGCLGLVVAFASALLMWWLTLTPSTGSSEPEQFEALQVTPPGQAAPLPPLPQSIAKGGPPLPEPVIDRDQCGDLENGGPTKDSCITAEIKCDEMIIGHTLGGVDRYDSDYYDDQFCWPATVNHDSGDERIYRLEMPPGDWRAWVTLQTPCADLTLAAIRHDRPSCPTVRDQIRQCEMHPRDNYQTERLELVSQTPENRNASWYIVVEGRDDDEGPFSLHVQCAPGVHGKP